MDYADVKEVREVSENPEQVDRMQALFDGCVVSVCECGERLYYRYCDVDGLKVSKVFENGANFVVLEEPYDFTCVLEDFSESSAPRIVTILH